MQRSLIGRLEALEQREAGADSIDTILITFMRPTEGGPAAVEPIAIKEMRGDWRLEREPGEAIEDFRDRASRLCPRPPRGVALLREVAA
jgi:hypothetical protein